MTKKKATKKPEKKIRLSKGSKTETDFLVLLDASGSMGGCKEETISNFNEQVEAIKKAGRGQKATVSLCTFNTPGQEKTILWRRPVEDIEKLTDASYKPGGTTAMYDCIVANVDRLAKELGEPLKPPARSTSKPNPSVLVIIISDGYENASIHASQSDVAERIQAMQATNRWTFTYMGSNQDLSKVSRELRIPIGNTMDYLASKQGTKSAGHAMAQAVSCYTIGRAAGMSATSNLLSREDRVRRVRDTAGSMAAEPKWKTTKKGA